MSTLLLVVGSPRSGTTLATRLIRELPGTSGVPFETHYFELVVREHVRRGGVLLDPAEQRESVARWQADPRIGTALDLDRVVGNEPRSCAELFRILVSELSLDPRADVLVEKTPGHLWMWPLVRDLPDVRFVALVRDPRAVVASLRGQEWAGSDLVSACTWAQEHAEIRRMQRALGPERVLVVRYEELVADAEGFRSGVGRFLGLAEAGPGPQTTDLGAGELFREWEGEWKTKALGQIDAHRSDAWREELTPEQVSLVETMVGRSLRRAGYRREMAGRRRTPAEWYAWLGVLAIAIDGRLVGRAASVDHGSEAAIDRGRSLALRAMGGGVHTARRVMRRLLAR